jgi:hypothetical protein
MDEKPSQFGLKRLFLAIVPVAVFANVIRQLDTETAVCATLAAVLIWPIVRYTDWRDIAKCAVAVAAVVALLIGGCYVVCVSA